MAVVRYAYLTNCAERIPLQVDRYRRRLSIYRVPDELDYRSHGVTFTGKPLHMVIARFKLQFCHFGT